MAKTEFACYTIRKAEKGLFQACRVDPTGGSPEPLPLPYGAAYERRFAVREASNALYRELCLGLKRDDALATRGISPDFKISGR